MSSKRDENPINRKTCNFYIEAVPQIFSQLRKKIIRARLKNFKFLGNFDFSKGFLIKALEICKLFKNVQHFRFFRPPKKFFFQKTFLEWAKNIFFGVEIFWWVQLRCKKLWSFDLWCFQSVWSTRNIISRLKTKNPFFSP